MSVRRSFFALVGLSAASILWGCASGGAKPDGQTSIENQTVEAGCAACTFEMPGVSG